MLSPTAVLSIALTIPLLALGGVTPETLLGSILAIAFALLSLRRENVFGSFGRDARIAAGALALLALVPLLQLIPLPPGLLRAVSPNAASAWAASDVLAQRTQFRPISVDPPGTWFAAATSLAVFGFFCIAVQHASTRGGRVRLAQALIFSIGAFGLIALLHGVFSVEKLFGIHETVHVQAGMPIHPTLVNPNHAAAAFAVAPPLFVGLTLEAKSPPQRALLIFGAVVSAALGVMCLSRGGIAVLLAEGSALIAYGLGRRQERRSRLRAAAIAGAVAGALVALVSYTALEKVRVELASRDVSKLQIAMRALDLAREFAWTGVGRGAFAAAFPRVEADLQQSLTISHGRFTHPENWPVQLAAELGFPIATIVVALFAVAVGRTASACTSRPLRFGALVALGGLALHDMFDFALEFVGCGLLAATLLAIVTAADDPSGKRGPKECGRLPIRLTVTVVAIAVTVAAVLSVQARGRLLDDDEDLLRRRWIAGTLASSKEEILSATGRHPVDPYVALVDAVASSAKPDAGARYLHALKLGPTRGITHYWFARWLLAVDRKAQAWAELREARRLAPAFAGQIVETMMLAGAGLAELQVFAVDEKLLDELSVRLDLRGRTVDAESNDERLIERYPPAANARLRQIARATTLDPKKALVLARALRDSARADVRGWAAVASLCDEAPDCAEQTLQQALKELGEEPGLLEPLARAQAKRLGVEAARGTLDRLVGALARKGAAPDRAFAVRAELDQSSGRWAAAIQGYLDAATVAAQPAGYLEAAAVLAEAHEQWHIAKDAYERLVALAPDVPRYRAGLERLSSPKPPARLPPP